ncbi:MAG: DUF58 domain-containing protein [Verrucomicrobia bacterium]|nr:DUF58 domain-containing protein [Verrucomicrobiota bacterium]
MSEPDFLDHRAIARLSKLMLHVRNPMLGNINGQHRSATRGASVEFAEYRKYAPGDDIKHLDWRVFGRTDKFFIREFEADTNLRCYLVVDTSASMKFSSNPATGSRFDYARRLAGTIAHLLVHQGDAVGLTCFAEKAVDLPPRRTPSHLRQLQRRLADIQPAGESQIVQTLHDFAERIRQRALVIIISDLFTDVPPLLDALKHLHFYKHDVAVFHLLDPQEFSFDFTRPTRFVDLETGADLITDPAIIRDPYLAALQSYLADLQHGCRQFQVDYHFTQINQPFDAVLTQFMLQRLRIAKKGGR